MGWQTNHLLLTVSNLFSFAPVFDLVISIYEVGSDWYFNIIFDVSLFDRRKSLCVFRRAMYCCPVKMYSLNQWPRPFSQAQVQCLTSILRFIFFLVAVIKSTTSFVFVSGFLCGVLSTSRRRRGVLTKRGLATNIDRTNVCKVPPSRSTCPLHREVPWRLVCTDKSRLWPEITTTLFALNKSCLLTLCPKDCCYGSLALAYVRPHVLFTLRVMDCTVSSYLLLRNALFYIMFIFQRLRVCLSIKNL